VCLARRFTDNIVADTSQVALICQCSKCTRGTPPRSRKRTVCGLLDKPLRVHGANNRAMSAGAFS
jgi:hypothetical protein